MAIGNSINDEIREQHQKIIEQEGAKGRIQYFMYYYKWHLLIGALVLFGVLYTTFTLATKKDLILQVVCVNAYPNIEPKLIMEDFEKNITIDKKKEETFMDASFYINKESSTLYDEQNYEKLFIMASAGVIDVVITDESNFLTMAEAGFLLDFSTIFSEEQMTQYKDRMRYYDSPNNYTQGEEAVAIEITNSAKIAEAEYYPEGKAYFCMIMNTPHIENSLAFLEYLDTP